MLEVILPVLLGIILPAALAVVLASLKPVPPVVGRALFVGALGFALNQWGVGWSSAPAETLQLWLWVLPLLPWWSPNFRPQLKLGFILLVSASLCYIQLIPFIENDWTQTESIVRLGICSLGLVAVFKLFQWLWGRSQSALKVVLLLTGCIIVLFSSAAIILLAGNLLLSHMVLFLIVYISCHLGIRLVAFKWKRDKCLSWLELQTDALDLGTVGLFLASMLLEAYFFSDF